MRDSAPSLYAYIITSLFVVIFYVLKWDDFITVVKPVIVPAIYYYYIQTTKDPVDILFSFALWLFFIADMIEIVDSGRGIYLIMLCGLLSYLIMFRYGLRDRVQLNFGLKILTFTIIPVASLVLASTYILKNLGSIDTLYFTFFIIYTFIIIGMVCYAVLRLFSSNDQLSRVFFAMVGVMFLSDILYAFNRYVEFYTIIGVLSFMGQFISYYWMVEYFNRRSNTLN